MSANFHKNSAGILASALIGLIILSFMFSGFQRGMGPKTADTIAEVDGTPIKIQEFQNMYERQMNFYRQIFNTTNLTSEQIKKFQIKEKTLEGLIQQKIMVNFSKKLNITPSEEEIASTIQGQEYFKNNGVFDITRYKAALTHAGLSPAEYEDSIAQSIQLQTVANLTQFIPVSKSYATELINIKKDVIKVKALQVFKSALPDLVIVPKDKINSFLSNPENNKKLENYFNGRKSSLDQPLQAKARHILIRVTEEASDADVLTKIEEIHGKVNNQNFAELAKKYSEDPSGKDKGGELPLIKKGMTVPEFENALFELKNGEISKPFKSPYGYHIVQMLERKEEVVASLETYKEQMAKEILQKEDAAGLKMLEDNILSEAKSLLSEGNIKKIQDFEKKYNAKYITKNDLSKLDDMIDSISLPENEQAKIFNESNTKTEKEFIINNPSELVVMLTQKSDKENGEGNLIDERNKQQKLLSEQNQEAIYKLLRDHSKVKVFANL